MQGNRGRWLSPLLCAARSDYSYFGDEEGAIMMSVTAGFQLLGLFCAAVAGVAWSLAPARRYASGQEGLVRALLPAAGAYLSAAYC